MNGCVCGHKRYWHSYVKKDKTKCMFIECNCNEYKEDFINIKNGGGNNGVI